MKSKTIFQRFTVSMFILLFFACYDGVFAGQTGKLAGRITDSETGEPCIGATVQIEGTYLGAAADLEGYYYINNIPPGEYTIIVNMIGYRKQTIKGIQVKIDLTTKQNIRLVPNAVQMSQEVIIQADRPLVQKDLTSTSVTVSNKEIQMIPVENIGQIINLQAGVVGGHFRGGRSNEVAYLIDGIPVTDPFNGGMSIQIENSSIREMEVISGTFNAEYGQAMSGVVNIVTQEGSQSNTNGNVSAYIGNFITNHTDLFENLDKIDAINSKNVQLSLSGPVPFLKPLNYFITGRYFKEDGSLFGKRVYRVTDDRATTAPDGALIAPHTGDGSYVPMNPAEWYSINGKITYPMPSLKISYGIFYDDNKNKYYDHSFRWAPDGIMNHYRTSLMQNIQITNTPSQSTYQTLKYSYNLYKYKGYLYEDPFDKRYVDPKQGIPTSGYTYRAGGNQTGRYERNSKTQIIQYSINSQLSNAHKFGAGLEARLHDIYNHGYEVVNLSEGMLDSLGNSLFTLGYRKLGSIGNQEYTKKPYEFSAYLQDKMENDIMIINAGIRFEYFNSNAELPADLKNPTKNPNFPGANQFVKSDAKFQISPRLGISFPITDQGIIHFSYGHFFQIPNFENLYMNSEYIVQPGQSLSSMTGNPNLNPQRTVSYEVGLQQVLFPSVVLYSTVYYRDIRNLLGMEIINTYEGFKYARFINRDYGNVRGFVVTLERRFTDYFGAKIDYTYQIAEGNASDPMQVFNNNQTDPPIETTKKVVPLDWDQRSTLNMAMTYGKPGDWNVGLIFSYGTGMPYTEDVKVSSGLRFENGGLRPAVYNLDLRAEKNFSLFGINVQTFLFIYNLLDIKNEYGVYGTTGRSTYDLNIKYASDVIGLNTIDQYIKNPGMYSSPRQIRIGLNFGF